MILAIDPGNEMSAYVLLDKNLKPIQFAKTTNEELISILDLKCRSCDYIVIENIASYGMSVGASVFETCIWIGRFTERIKMAGAEVNYIYRKDEKINLCGTMKAKDSNIRQALIDRFGVVGTKANKGFFYGFKADIWSAYAVAITFYDIHLKGEYNGKSI